jgi:hypothetical protein
MESKWRATADRRDWRAPAVIAVSGESPAEKSFARIA